VRRDAARGPVAARCANSAASRDLGGEGGFHAHAGLQNDAVATAHHGMVATRISAAAPPGTGFEAPSGIPVTTASKILPEWMTAELIGKLVSESMNFMDFS
jgi:hypothetical protein